MSRLAKNERDCVNAIVNAPIDPKADPEIISKQLIAIGEEFMIFDKGERNVKTK